MLTGCTHTDVPRALVLKSKPVGFSRDDPHQSEQGRLTFRGGIQLSSSDPDFGGISAILISEDGASFVAVTDEAHWVTGTLEYKGGNLARATGDQIAPMLDPEAAPLQYKTGDAEGLAAGESIGNFDDLFVSFEGKHRVWRYPFGKDGVRAVPVNVPLSADAVRAPRNRGLEGITRIADGTLLAVNENFLNLAADYRAWLVPFPVAAPTIATSTIATSAATPLPPLREISFLPKRPYGMTDVRQLPGNDILTLERAYDAIHGVRVQLRRIPWASIDPSSEHGPIGPLDGEVVATLNPNFEIDNMEGMSVRQGAEGEIFVYLVSDDNFNRPLQRTLLLMYELR